MNNKDNDLKSDLSVIFEDLLKLFLQYIDLENDIDIIFQKQWIQWHLKFLFLRDQNFQYCQIILSIISAWNDQFIVYIYL